MNNQAIEIIKAIGDIITPIALAWIATIQMKMSKRQDKMENRLNTGSKYYRGSEGENTGE